MRKALDRVLRLLSVGSKRFLTNKVDRRVTGLIARQQCAGPLQLTVSDVAVIAQSHFGLTGAAISIGEQPVKELLDPAAMARMSVGEALTNIVWAEVSALGDIRCSANWMWAPKLPGEGARLYDAAVAMRDVMIELGIAVDGGKDSLSMAAKVTNRDGSHGDGQVAGHARDLGLRHLPGHHQDRDARPQGRRARASSCSSISAAAGTASAARPWPRSSARSATTRRTSTIPSS